MYLKSILEKEHKIDYQFDVVNHLNRVPEFFEDPEERLELAKLNLAVTTQYFHL